MVKEKKSVPFSTRLTETMDKRLEELSEVLMLTKHDIVRAAISEFLVRKRELIDSHIEYKNNNPNTRYDTYSLVHSKSSLTSKEEDWICGLGIDPDDEVYLSEDLVRIEVKLIKPRDESLLPELLDSFKTASEEHKKILKEKLHELSSAEIREEISLEFTELGLEAKQDPKFREVLKSGIKELIDKERKAVEKHNNKRRE